MRLYIVSCGKELQEAGGVIGLTYVFLLSLHRTTNKHHNPHFMVFALSVFEDQLK